MDVGKVEVAEVVVDGAAAAYAAGGLDTKMLAGSVIDLGTQILVFAADYGFFTPPKQKNILGCVVQKMGFCRQIIIHIRGG